MISDTIKKGFQRAPHRSLLRAVGLKEDDFDKPFIGIANSYTDIIPEPLGGAHRDPQQAGLAVENYIARTLRHLCRVPIDKLIERRYQKLRIIGSLTDGSIKLTNEKPTKKTAEKKKTRAKKKGAKNLA